MKSVTHQLLVWIVILGFAVQSRAATASETIAPLMNETTVAVIRCDLEKVNIADIRKAITDSIDSNKSIDKNQRREAIESMEEPMKIGERWLGDMKKSGGKEIYVLFDVTAMRYGPVLVVPKTEGANVKSIGSLLHSGTVDGESGIVDQAQVATRPTGRGTQLQTAEVKNLIVHAPKTWIDAANKAASIDRPNLTKAFESAGNGPISVAVVPSDTIRAMLEQAMPVIPPEMGGGPVTDLSRGIEWISIATGNNINDPARIVAQANSPEAAAKIEEIANTAIDLMLGNQEIMQATPELAVMLGKMRPSVDGAKLSVDVTSNMLSGALMPRMMMARGQARSVQSMSNMRQLVLAIIMYANDNKGAFPAELTDLKKYLGDNDGTVIARILTNPQTPDQKPGYIYIKPNVATIKEIRSSHERLIIYENYSKWPGKINVGFADGHVEMIVDKARFEKLLTDAGGKMPEEKTP